VGPFPARLAKYGNKATAAPPLSSPSNFIPSTDMLDHGLRGRYILDMSGGDPRYDEEEH